MCRRCAQWFLKGGPWQVWLVCSVLLLLCAAMCSTAKAEGVWVCWAGAEEGAAGDSGCPSWATGIADAGSLSDELVSVCTGGTISAGDAGSACDGSNIWKKISNLSDGDVVLSAGGYCCGTWLAASVFGTDSSSGAALDIPDLTWSQWGEIMTALLGLFVLAGVVRVIKNSG